MQGVASIIDIARVATDKRWRNQERLTRCNIRLECRHISYINSQLSRFGCRVTALTVKPNSSDSGEFPSYVQST